jgi:hypothetical protein
MTVRSPAALAVAAAGIVVFAAATILVLKGPAAPTAREDAVAVHLIPWADNNAWLRMYTTVLGTANANGRGFTLHEGIVGVSLTGDEEQTVLIVRFGEGLRKSRRDSLLAGIRASPLVARVEPATLPTP